MILETVIFYILAVITLASALCVVLLRRPLHNVLFMILTMLGVAGLFLILQAVFVGLIQMIVYAGAIMTLFMFPCTGALIMLFRSLGKKEAAKVIGVNVVLTVVVGIVAKVVVGIVM